MGSSDIKNIFPVWLIHSKISPIEQLVSLIDRPEPIRKLNKGLKGKLTLLSTPAGYGKTTLMDSWRRNLLDRGYKTAWLSLDSDDNDPGLLTTYITYSFWESGLSNSIQTISKEGFGPHISPKTMLGILSAALVESEEKWVLILDNFEKLTHNCIQNVIEPALKYFPENIHIAIACRTKAELSLSELRLSGQVNELGSQEIKFTSIEIQTFLEQFLNKDEIQLAIERSEGWPVALQYLRIALTRSNDQKTVLNSFNGAGKEIEEYFSEHLLNTLEEEQRLFLLETSILEDLTIDAVDYIRKRTDSEILLKSMHDIDAFVVPIKDDEEKNYHLHPLLREFLQNNLRLNYPEKYIQLQHMSALWYAQKGKMIRAIRYALEVNELDLAADIVEKSGGVLLWNREGMSRIRTANDLLPDEVISRRPRLQLMRALVLLKDGKLNEGREIIQYVRKIKLTLKDRLIRYDIAILTASLDAYEGSDPTEDIIKLRELLFELAKDDDSQISFIYTTSCLSCIQYGQFDEAREFAHKGITKLREINLLFGIPYFDFHLGVINFAEGLLNNAFSKYQKAQNAFRHYYSDDKDMKLILNILMAEWHYERNEIETAKRLLGDTNNRLVNGEAWYEIYAAGYTTSTSIAYENEGLDSCRQLSIEAEQYIQHEGLKRLRRLIIANMAGYLTRSGKLKEARKLIQKNGLSLKEYKAQENKNYLIRERFGVVVSLSRLLIVEKRYQEAIDELSFFIKIEQAINYNRAVLKLSILKSIALFSSAKKKTAYEILNIILPTVRKEGYVRLILDENPLVKPVLICYVRSKVANEKDHGIYLLDLLDENIETHVIMKFSKRERQVLELLSKGLADKVISKNLEISTNTVRFHLKNIYSKLGVNNRTQAVKKATLFL